MKKVTINKKNKTIISLLLFFMVCIGINESIQNKQSFTKANYELEDDFKLEVSENDKIEDIVGTNDNLSNFYLKLINSNGDNEVTHPKVISFNKKWNGYKYWIAYTPYPKGNQAQENPHIMVSNDLVNWQVKKGFENPLDEPEDKDYQKVYNSDTHLVYNSDTDRLECYWRYVNDKENKVIIYKRTTRNGINWTEKEIVLENERNKVDYLSPAIIYENRKYMFWYVDRDKTVKYMEYDLNTKEWTTPRIIDIKYSDEKLKSWHLDVIKTKDSYEMIIVAFSDWNKRSKMNLYYSKSEDNINYTEAKEILKAANNGGIYRSSILYINNTYYIFYSEITKKYKRGVGIVYGTDIDNLNGLRIKDINKFTEYIKKNG
jgi:hypothetical protein